MRRHYFAKFTLVFFIALLSFSDTKATICNSIANGTWASAATWSCGRKPSCGDTIHIYHFVELAATEDYSGCLLPMFIVVHGGAELNFDSGRKLKLPCGSGVTVQDGAQMTSDGGGASESLQICSATVWEGSDGDVTVFTVFGSGLPIELISFEVYFNGENADITWTTATETNNDYFTVERSADGIHFEEVVITDGAGNSSIQLNYFEVDYAPLSGTSYYRLKQTDFNGNFSYGPMQTLKTYLQVSNELYLYPNPCDGSFHLQLNGFGDEEFLVVVRDLAGKQHYSKVIVTSTDSHIEAIDPSSKLAAGTYIITASSRNELYTQKLVVR